MTRLKQLAKLSPLVQLIEDHMDELGLSEKEKNKRVREFCHCVDKLVGIKPKTKKKKARKI
jgi:hypothetical protein